MKAIKSAAQLEDLRRRDLLGLSADGPMVRKYKELPESQYGYLPTMEMLTIRTPLGHFKTKLLEMGFDLVDILFEVESYLRVNADGFAFHNRDERRIGTRMYDALKLIVCKRLIQHEDNVRIFLETFPL